MKMVEGKCGIKATVIADSISSVLHAPRMLTLEIEYPRFILAELNTHRMLSKNSSSSRAVPASKAIDAVMNSPALPVFWGKNQAGMQAKEEIEKVEEAKFYWNNCKEMAATYVDILTGEDEDIHLHKQTACRLIEPWQMMKTVISGTEWGNFFWLRDDPAAQPEFQELARCIKESTLLSVPVRLHPGEWHLPYVHSVLASLIYKNSGERKIEQVFLDPDRKELTLEEAKKISVSCCAQVSYRKLDQTKEKALAIYDKLISGGKIHASPFEHQATPMKYPEIPNIEAAPRWHYQKNWQEGVTHMDSKARFWSGNLRGWIQNRQLIGGNYHE